MTQLDKRTRILVAKPGLDVHDRGAILLCKAFRDAGMEVIYTGLWQTFEKIAKAAIEEDVDAIAVSLLDGQPLPIFKNIIEELKKNGGENICLIGGGTAITDNMKPQLKEMGVLGLYGPGTPLNVIVDGVTKLIENSKN
ncbi:MAG: cobalamin-dependent protein [Spirochaetota bacterium]|nr:cobalamin-dependent protein [Spirochaetota bacterium]